MHTFGSEGLLSIGSYLRRDEVYDAIAYSEAIFIAGSIDDGSDSLLFRWCIYDMHM